MISATRFVAWGCIAVVDAPGKRKARQQNWECGTQCGLCQVEFTKQCPRHHCRSCGKSVCGNHSTHRMPVPHDQAKDRPLTQLATSIRNWGVLSKAAGLHQDKRGEHLRVCDACAGQASDMAPVILTASIPPPLASTSPIVSSPVATVSSPLAPPSYSPGTTNAEGSKEPCDALDKTFKST